ncbi:TRAFs-binding domain-containing protein [Kocuria sabuli]|uniref:TRAFs-binding domain-containing protein n=1 Tax=Kocuria sabuli TaxID=3071448 RepID=UPI0034D39BE6
MSEDLAPTAFIVMPYGNKRDHTTGLAIDFDNIWNTAFLPAAKSAGIEPVRADEERLGGFVHLAMFERLVLAEIVLADLTLASPNVMYELGIRHATRPRATISTYATVSQLPFDVSPIRAIPYRLDRNGRLTKASRESLIEALGKRFRECREDTAFDSPLFQLIRDYPGVTLSHEATETFQRRAQSLLELSIEIRTVATRLPTDEALKMLHQLADRVATLGQETPTDLLVDLLLAYRDVAAYEEMVDLEANLPLPLRRHPTVKQQLAFALNRRNAPGDAERAISILQALKASGGYDPETSGILGRIYKDKFRRLRHEYPEQAHEALLDAIKTYEDGFRADLRDYYPGVNALTLMIVEGSEECLRRARELSPIVAFAVAVRQGVASHDYWDVATVLELAVGRTDEREAQRALNKLLYLNPPRWVRTTIADNLVLLQEALENDGPLPWLDDLLNRLRPSASAG